MFFQKAPTQLFDKALNAPLKYAGEEKNVERETKNKRFRCSINLTLVIKTHATFYDQINLCDQIV